jgi:hypothetical protein
MPGLACCAREASPPDPESNVVAEAVSGGFMERLKKALDPMQVGSEAGKLASGLHQRIVGQDEAIHAIVSAYQCERNECPIHRVLGVSSPPVGLDASHAETSSGL